MKLKIPDTSSVSGLGLFSSKRVHTIAPQAVVELGLVVKLIEKSE